MSALARVSSDVFSHICCFLPLRDKALQLSHLSRGFHCASPACFNGDAMLLSPAVLDEAEREARSGSSRVCSAATVVLRLAEWCSTGRPPSSKCSASTTSSCGT